VEVGYGLSEHAHKRAKKLSGGTQRKLSAAMALSCGAPARGEWPHGAWPATAGPAPWLARPPSMGPAGHLTPRTAPCPRSSHAPPTLLPRSSHAPPAGTPAVVFVDEPTTGVDVGTRRFIWDRIREAARGRCVVLTTN